MPVRAPRARVFPRALPYLAALLCALAPFHARAARDFPVAFCFDGDTLRLADGRSVRLAGIDCPELGHGKMPDQHYAREARALTEGFVKGGKVRLVRRGRSPDRHQRLVAEVLLPDGRSLNLLLVRAGAAFVYAHPDLPENFFSVLLRAQREAVRERRGLWEELLRPREPARYIGNARSRRFFPEQCKGAKNIRPERRLVFSSLEDAFGAGFAPARHCGVLSFADKAP